MRNSIRIIFLLSLVFCAFWAHADEPGNCTTIDASTRPDCPQAIAFFEKLQAAVKQDKRDEVVSMVSFPMRTTPDGKRTIIRSRQQFLLNYRPHPDTCGALRPDAYSQILRLGSRPGIHLRRRRSLVGRYHPSWRQNSSQRAGLLVEVPDENHHSQ
jgi:hypothetical protein